MPIPAPRKDETKKKFLSRCMSNGIMVEEYEKEDQRYRICNNQWKNKNKSKKEVKNMSVIRIQSDSLEARMEIVRVGVWDLFKKLFSDDEGVNVGILATFSDAVIVKDYDSQKMYELKYLIIDSKVSFEDPKEVDNVYVVKQLINENPDVTLKDMQDLLDSWDDWSVSLEKYEAVIKGKSGIDNPKALWTQLYFQKKAEWPEEKIEMKTKSFIELTGPIVFKNDKKRIAYAAVLVPGEEDSDGEIVSKAKIEDAAHEWMEDYQHIDLKHSLNAAGKPVESYLTYSERTVKSLDGEEMVLPEGTWILGSKLDEKTFKGVESGDLTGYSVMGVARKSLKEKDLKKALKSLKDDTDILKVLKKTLLKDLGPDWVPVAVAVVGSPAVPKSKWFALKSKVVKPKETLWEKILKTLKGNQEKSKIKLIKKGGKNVNEERKKKIKEVLKSIKDEKGEIEEEKLVAEIEKIVEEDVGKVEPVTTKEPIDAKIAEKIEETVKGMIEAKLKEAVEAVQKEIETLKTQIAEFGKAAETTEKAIKEMTEVLGIDPSKALKGQDGDDGDKAKKGKALDFGDRDSFGRKITKKGGK